MAKDRIYLTLEQAISCLPQKEEIHTFMNPSGGVLFGADMSRESIIETFKDNEGKIEVGGEQCRRMKHGIVVWQNGDPLFVEADNEKLSEIEAQHE